MGQVKTFLLFILLFGSLTVIAQISPQDPYPGNRKISYVRVWEASAPERNANTLMTRPLEDVGQTTDYLDGLGRLVQRVVKQGSVIQDPNNTANSIVTDLVSATRYDQLGNYTLHYQPFSANNAGSNSSIDDGLFKSNPFQQQAAFMQSKFTGETYYYGKEELEASPLQRILNAYGPGDSWVGSSKGVTNQYEVNAVTEGVRIWNINFSTGSIPYSTSVYPTGSLIKKITLDANGKKTYSYEDFDGKTILKKVQDNDAGAGLDENSHTGWLSTYFVYDDLGQLRVTITPKAVKYLETITSWVFASSEVYQELCYWYEFDERGRAIVKHSPGGGQLYMVYDNRNRLVLTQDDNQRLLSQWNFYLYDDLDRNVVTGLFNNGSSRETMAAYVKNLNNGNVQISVYSGASETVTVNNPVSGGAGYCNNCTNTVINTINYFDEYGYPGVKAFSSSFSFASTSNPYVEPVEKTNRTIGSLTGTKTRVINDGYDDNNIYNDQFLVSTVYYDDKARSLQCLADNIKGAVDYITNQYDFSGKIAGTCEKHTMPGTSISNFQTITKLEYDKLSRLSVLSKQYASNPLKKVIELNYDELGRVKTKKLSPDYNSGTGIEALKFDYNIRGWLNGINKDYALAYTALNQWDHFFGMLVGYDNRDNKFTSSQLLGNPTGVLWKTQGDNMPRRYDYEYDNSGRFKKALFVQKEIPTDAVWNNTKMDFSVTDILYDENDNLKQLYQKGVIPGNNAPVFIDKLNYYYKTVASAEWSNQLSKVFDNFPTLTSTTNGSVGDFKDEVYGSNTNDYVFDGNGNLVIDNNKKIRVGSGNGIKYNFMDKPQKITIEGKAVVDFVYSANGEKLGKKVTSLTTGSITTTWYVGDFIYEESNSQTTLSSILHEEGRIRVYQPAANWRITQGGNFDLPDNKKGAWEYYIKDHLENTRLIVSEETHSEFNNCTMENSDAYYEERMFGQVNSSGAPLSGQNEVVQTRVNKTDAAGWNANSSGSISKLSYYTNKVGPNVILKVMAGDNVTLKSDYYYTGSVDNSDNNNILTPLLNNLLSTLANTTQTTNLHGNSSAINSNYTATPGNLGSYLTAQSAGGSGTPQAYMNVLFFDENFNFVPYDAVTGLGSYGWRVQNPGDGQYFTLKISKAPKNGYAFVYLSNESKTTVYFDNFEVTHIRGRITEENAFYPYGLKIAGISARAFDKGDNKYKFQGTFSEEESETGYNEFALRLYDPQIGRWTTSDPYDQFSSPYVGMGANPVCLVDPDGGDAGEFIGAMLKDWKTYAGLLIGAGVTYLATKGEDKKTRQNKVAAGFLLGAFIGHLTEIDVETGYRIVETGINMTQAMTQRGFVQLRSDLETFSDLILTTDDNNNLTYHRKRVRIGFTFDKEKPRGDSKWANLFEIKTRRKEGGSATARKILTSAIKSERIVDVAISGAATTSWTPGSGVNINPGEMARDARRTRNADKRTMGWGMSFLHEYLHSTGLFDFTGGLDNRRSPGDVEKLLNKVRRQLGSYYGQRMIYFDPGASFIPLDKQSMKDLINGRGLPDRNSQHLRLIE